MLVFTRRARDWLTGVWEAQLSQLRSEYGCPGRETPEADEGPADEHLVIE